VLLAIAIAWLNSFSNRIAFGFTSLLPIINRSGIVTAIADLVLTIWRSEKHQADSHQDDGSATWRQRVYDVAKRLV
jgi:hypothetical protein